MSLDYKKGWNFSVKTMVVGVLLAVFTAAPAVAGSANPFKKLSGSWRSHGAVAYVNGHKESIKCRAKYSVPGRSVIISLKCSGPGYFLNVRMNTKVYGRKVKGNWSESQFGKSGWISGSVKRSSSSMSFAGGGISGTLRVSMPSSRRHAIYINANGTRVTIPLRR